MSYFFLTENADEFECPEHHENTFQKFVYTDYN